MDLFNEMLVIVMGMAGIAIALFTLLNFMVDFKVDVQEIGQEQFDRYTLVESVLSAEGCTLKRGVFELDKVNEPNQLCQFKSCDVSFNQQEKKLNWGYILVSKELGLHTGKKSVMNGHGCRKGGKNPPSFRYGQSIPVVLHNNSTYYSGHMLIYGPNGVITKGISGRSRQAKDNFQKKIDQSGKTASFQHTFACDAPQVKNAYCRITSIETFVKETEYPDGAKMEATLDVSNGKTFEVSGEAEKQTGSYIQNKGWRFTTNVEKKDLTLTAGEELAITSRWKYSFTGSIQDPICAFRGLFTSGCQETQFSKAQITVHYDVVCPAGSSVEQKEQSDGSLAYTCAEQPIGEQVDT